MLKKIMLSVAMVLALATPAHAYYYHNGYGYVSNVCAVGNYWQFVPYNYVGTVCYMPMWNLHGKRVAE